MKFLLSVCSKSTVGGGGPDHLKMWWLEKTWPTPSIWNKTEWPTPKKDGIFGRIIKQDPTKSLLVDYDVDLFLGNNTTSKKIVLLSFTLATLSHVLKFWKKFDNKPVKLGL